MSLLLKVVPMSLILGLCIYYTGTWTHWEMGLLVWGFGLLGAPPQAHGETVGAAGYRRKARRILRLRLCRVLGSHRGRYSQAPIVYDIACSQVFSDSGATFRIDLVGSKWPGEVLGNLW